MIVHESEALDLLERGLSGVRPSVAEPMRQWFEQLRPGDRLDLAHALAVEVADIVESKLCRLRAGLL
jgi:hypothetical protein